MYVTISLDENDEVNEFKICGQCVETWPVSNSVTMIMKARCKDELAFIL